MISLSRILVLATVFVAVIASSGDRSADFGKCLTRCTKDQCHPGYTQPLALRLTRWTCTDDCKYTCMHETTAHDIARGDRVQQYYGKWPFLRLAGLQEPASVVFSVLNLWSHVQGMQKLRKAIPDSHPMKSYYLLWSLASINAWTWSSVFHTRGQRLSFKREKDACLISSHRLAGNRKTRLLLCCVGNNVRAVLHCRSLVPPILAITTKSAYIVVHLSKEPRPQDVVPSVYRCLPCTCLILDTHASFRLHLQHGI